ncbi:MAG: putative transcriptional regulator [Anaerocolumna sp.]|jgi:DNA-binding PadR family transcriptional regulator|nr:putative transcriptional regulator [Anaerocolumna sp.]
MIKNKTRYAILGALSLMQGSGYDIKKFCDNSISHFWNENYGHIYPVLAQLEKEGCIEQVNQNSDNRRKVYQSTQKGKEEFTSWLMTPIDYQPARSELLLKLFYGNFAPKDKILLMLNEVRESKMKQLDEFKRIEDSYIDDEKAQESEVYVYWVAPLRYGIIATEAFIKWCDETIDRIENK